MWAFIAFFSVVAVLVYREWRHTLECAEWRREREQLTNLLLQRHGYPAVIGGVRVQDAASNASATVPIVGRAGILKRWRDKYAAAAGAYAPPTDLGKEPPP